MFSVAARTVIVLGARQREKNGATKIWRKLARNGIAESSPMAGLGRAQPFVTSAVRNTFTGSPIVTMGIAARPSWVHNARLRWRSALRWADDGLAVRVRVAFKRRLGGMKGDGPDY
jgi:hypothetical protein